LENSSYFKCNFVQDKFGVLGCAKIEGSGESEKVERMSDIHPVRLAESTVRGFVIVFFSHNKSANGTFIGDRGEAKGGHGFYFFH
jgi:hypothetical protein